MNAQLHNLIRREAINNHLIIEAGFIDALDAYITRHFPYDTERNKLVIQTYIARAAFRIALTEGKNALESEDVKDAIWFFHLPDQPDDPCAEAGRRTLVEEQRRPHNRRGLLTESFSNFLDNN